VSSTVPDRRVTFCTSEPSIGRVAGRLRLPVTVNPQPAPRLTVDKPPNGLPFLFFLDAGHDRGSPLYHRHDGHYGLLTPQASLVMSLCPQERGRVVAASCCGGRAGCLVSPHFLFRG
jgi:hypothetical protein